ncbi:hypothetical protein ENBRE01_1631 [Enteropsectra breve]|nr:hypothetical protein ENBRE01_1631 [Enteropsectra breve]
MEDFIKELMAWAHLSTEEEGEAYVVKGKKYFLENLCNADRRKVFLRIMAVEGEANIQVLAEQYFIYLNCPKCKKQVDEAISQAANILRDDEFLQAHGYSKEFLRNENKVIRELKEANSVCKLLETECDYQIKEICQAYKELRYEIKAHLQFMEDRLFGRRKVEKTAVAEAMERLSIQNSGKSTVSDAERNNIRNSAINKAREKHRAKCYKDSIYLAKIADSLELIKKRKKYNSEHPVKN